MRRRPAARRYEAVCQGSVSISAKRTSTPSGASARSSDLGPALHGDPLGARVRQGDQGQALRAVGVVVLQVAGDVGVGAGVAGVGDERAARAGAARDALHPRPRVARVGRPAPAPKPERTRSTRPLEGGGAAPRPTRPEPAPGAAGSGRSGRAPPMPRISAITSFRPPVADVEVGVGGDHRDPRPRRRAAPARWRPSRRSPRPGPGRSAGGGSARRRSRARAPRPAPRPRSSRATRSRRTGWLWRPDDQADVVPLLGERRGGQALNGGDELGDEHAAIVVPDGRRALRRRGRPPSRPGAPAPGRSGRTPSCSRRGRRSSRAGRARSSSISAIGTSARTISSCAAGLHAERVPAAGVEVAHHVADVLGRHGHLDPHHGLEQHRPAPWRRPPSCPASRRS